MTRKTIVVLGLMSVVLGGVAVVAAPLLDTAFTYQGRLRHLVNDVAQEVGGACDFRVKLCDAEVGACSLGTQDLPAKTVTGSVFALQLDFGANVFDGTDRWLEIEVRCPDLGDTGYTTLPRQRITAAPYAIQTRGIFVDEDGNVGIGTTSPGYLLDVAGDVQAAGFRATKEPIGGYSNLRQNYNGSIFSGANNLNGIGYNVHLKGTAGGPEYDKFAPDASTWMEFPGSFIRFLAHLGTTPGSMGGVVEIMRMTGNGNVGIGTTTPQENLHIQHSANDARILLETTAGPDYDQAIIFKDSSSEWHVGNRHPSDNNNAFGIGRNAQKDDLVIDPSGKIGIGTTTPGQALTVVGTIESQSGGYKFPDASIQITAANGDITGIAANEGLQGGGSSGDVTVGIANGGVTSAKIADNSVANNDLASDASSLNKVSGGVMTSGSGNIGIGTAAPDAMLDLSFNSPTNANKAVEFELTGAGASDFQLVRNSTANGQQIRTFRIRGENDFASYTSFSLGMASNHPLAFVTAGAERMRITETGNVGIGTGAPQARLHVDGEFRQSVNGDFNIDSSGVVGGRVKVTAAGNVGIGETSPSVPLHIRGGSEASLAAGAGFLQIGPTDNNNMILDHNDIQRRQNGVAAELILQRFGGDVGIGDVDVPTRKLHVAGHAYKTTGGTVWETTSDARIKTEITTIRDALDILRQVQLRRFKYSSDWRARHPEVSANYDYGVVAQEFRDVFPEFVVEGHDGLLTVNTSPLAVYSVSAIQELDVTVRRMDEEIRTHKNQIAARDAEIAVMQERIARLESFLSTEPDAAPMLIDAAASARTGGGQ